jgi:hypothetical protein
MVKLSYGFLHIPEHNTCISIEHFHHLVRGPLWCLHNATKNLFLVWKSYPWCIIHVSDFVVVVVKNRKLGDMYGIRTQGYPHNRYVTFQKYQCIAGSVNLGMLPWSFQFRPLPRDLTSVWNDAKILVGPSPSRFCCVKFANAWARPGRTNPSPKSCQPNFGSASLVV